MTNWKERTLDSSGDVWDRLGPVEGELLKIEHDVGPNKSMMYTIKTKSGDVKVWGSTVLDDKLLGVPIGTDVKIEYEGKLQSKKGTSYHSYKVFIDADSMEQDAPNDEPDPEMPPDYEGLNDE